MARARVTGVVTISAKERRCQLLFVGGYIRAALGSESHSATQAEQVRERVAAVLRWEAVRCDLEATSKELGEAGSGAAEAMAALLLQAAEAGLPDEVAATQFDGGTLEATAFGKALLRAGVELLRQGSATRARAAVWIAALVPGRAENRRAYSVLVRKREQLRRCVSPRELLELHPHAEGAEAGRALRRLAANVHPDALGPAAPAWLQGVSSHVLCELVRAEQALRPGRRLKTGT